MRSNAFGDTRFDFAHILQELAQIYPNFSQVCPNFTQIWANYSLPKFFPNLGKKNC